MANLPRTIKTVWAVLLMAALFSITAFAANPFTSNSTIVQQDKENRTTLTIYKNHPEESSPFHADNMFPGDKESKTYLLAVSYRGTVTVHFQAEVREGYEKLAEVMNCRVALKDAEKPLYDGLMRDMPEIITHELISQRAVTDELEYEITAYLDTSVGNEYMEKELVADFRWWAVEETAPDDGGDDDDDSDRPEKPDRPTQAPGHDIITDQTTTGSSDEPFLPGELVKPPKTGDISLIPVVAVAIGCAVLLVLLLGRRRKEEAEYEK